MNLVQPHPESPPLGSALPAGLGYVRWPVHLSRLPGGCRVYAVAPAEKTTGEGPVFAYAPEGTARPQVDLPLLGFSRENVRDSLTDVRPTAGRELRVAVELGACPSRFQDRSGRAWACSRDDLTPEGRTLLGLLDALCAGEVRLVTVLDA